MSISDLFALENDASLLYISDYLKGDKNFRESVSGSLYKVKQSSRGVFLIPDEADTKVKALFFDLSENTDKKRLNFFKPNQFKTKEYGNLKVGDFIVSKDGRYFSKIDAFSPEGNILELKDHYKFFRSKDKKSYAKVVHESIHLIEKHPIYIDINFIKKSNKHKELYKTLLLDAPSLAKKDSKIFIHSIFDNRKMILKYSWGDGTSSILTKAYQEPLLINASDASEFLFWDRSLKNNFSICSGLLLKSL